MNAQQADWRRQRREELQARMTGVLDDTKRSANAVNACVNNDARQCKWGIVV